EIGLRAVVIHSEAAAHIEELHAGTDPRQFDINTSGLGQRILDVADVGDLAAEVKMDKLQAIGKIALFQVVYGFEDLRQCQAEFRPETGTGAPATRAACHQLDAYAHHGSDLQLGGVANDRFKLGELFDDGNDLLADLAGKHSHLDELVILEAIADD